MATKTKAETKSTAVKDPNKVTFSGRSMYAAIKTPNPGYKGGPAKWRVDLLLNLSELARARKLGVRVRGAGGTPSQNTQFLKYQEFVKTNKLDELGFTGEYIRFEKAVERKLPDKTVKTYLAPTLYDGVGNKIDPELDLKVGNGSDVRITGSLRKGGEDMPVDFGSYSLSLGYMTINKLVEYKPQAGFDINAYKNGDKSQTAVATTPEAAKDEPKASKQVVDTSEDFDDDELPFEDD